MINPWFSNPPSIWSFFGIIGSLVVCAVAVVYLWFCYFPGGYKKTEVMDIGEYAMFVAQAKVEERKKQLEKTEEEDYVNQYDELYYEMKPGEETPRNGDGEGKSRIEGSDWQSEGASEQLDIEGGEYYDETSSGTPSSRTQSQSHASQTYDGQSVLSPTSHGQSVTPSQHSGRQFGRDDRSEATYTSYSQSQY